MRPTGNEPTCTVSDDADAIDTIISARTRDIGGFNVGRVLPAIGRRMVGPFIFFDHMGPGDFEPGQGLDVRPHPHINLATVTYLFEGEIHHRDSLGSSLPIRPGAINWMTAGRGIVHSERSGDEARARGGRLHGIQLWVALPRKHEEVEPSFRHHPAESIPGRKIDEVEVRVLAGEAYGLRSPVRGLSRLFYVEAKIPRGQELILPDNYPERAAYVVSGAVVCERAIVRERNMMIFGEGEEIRLRAKEDAHLMLLGGEPLDGPRHIYWNFVSSRPERIEAAKTAWREHEFPLVPGDEEERIPLPDT